MPYPGISDPEKIRKMESCVEKVLAAHKGEEGFDKSRAIAICHSQIVGGIVLEPVSANMAAGYSHMMMGNAIEGELMMFRNAVLARAESNRNKDKIDEQGIEELAESLRFMPMTYEHKRDPSKPMGERQVVGFYLDGRAKERSTVLSVDGVVFAGIFPEVVKGLAEGKLKLSIEAKASKATCTKCGKEFAASADYCPHIATVQGRYSHQADRYLQGLKAIGGAVTANPAGTGTSFDGNAFTMIAGMEGPVESVSASLADELVLAVMADPLLSDADRQLVLSLSAALCPFGYTIHPKPCTAVDAAVTIRIDTDDNKTTTPENLDEMVHLSDSDRLLLRQLSQTLRQYGLEIRRMNQVS